MPRISKDKAEREESELQSDRDDFELPEERVSIIDRFRKLNFEEFLNLNKVPIMIALLGFILLGLGVFLFKNTSILVRDKIEVISEPTKSLETNSDLIVEIAGAVEKPGVYKLGNKSRVDDLLISAGGLSVDADREWVEKSINRAGKLSDGQKIFIKSVSDKEESVTGKQSDINTANSGGGYQSASEVLGVGSGGLTNINTATFAELDKLPGIGQVYGAKIIEQRPYSDIAELLSKGVLPKTTLEKIKDKITVY